MARRLLSGAASSVAGWLTRRFPAEEWRDHKHPARRFAAPEDLEVFCEQFGEMFGNAVEIRPGQPDATGDWTVERLVAAQKRYRDGFTVMAPVAEIQVFFSRDQVQIDSQMTYAGLLNLQQLVIDHTKPLTARQRRQDVPVLGQLPRMEVFRQELSRQTTQRATWVGLIGGAVASGAIEALKWVAG